MLSRFEYITLLNFIIMRIIDHNLFIWNDSILLSDCSIVALYFFLP